MATESDNVNSGALATLVAVGTVAMLGISLVVTALVRAEMDEELKKKEVSADRPYRDLVAAQTAQLNAPAAYKDRSTGVVSLPIDRAMELVVSELVKNPNSATPPPPKEEKDAAADAQGAAGAPSTTEADATPDKKESAEGEKQESPAPAPKPVPAAPAPKPAPVAPAPAAPTPPAPVPAPAPNDQ